MIGSAVDASSDPQPVDIIPIGSVMCDVPSRALFLSIAFYTERYSIGDRSETKKRCFSYGSERRPSENSYGERPQPQHTRSSLAIHIVAACCYI
jgi:hypothetical protein